MLIVTAVNWALNFVIAASFLQLSNIFTSKSRLFSCHVSDTSPTLKTFAFITLITYVCTFSFGFGPTTYFDFAQSEIFPPSIVDAFQSNLKLNFITQKNLFFQLHCIRHIPNFENLCIYCFDNLRMCLFIWLWTNYLDIAQ